MNYYFNKTSIFIILYLSLLIGFFFDENSSGGALGDFTTRFKLIENFRDNFIYTFLNYDQFYDRHSPSLIILLSSLAKIGFGIDSIRFIHLHFLPLLIIIFYKSVRLKFPNINKDIILIFCTVFFLSPSLRSISIWPDSRLLGLLFFVLSIYFFLKFKKNNKFIDCIYNNLFLVISAYISPNFSLFFLYFFYQYFKYYKFSVKLFLILLINFILSLPMLFYLFILKVNFFFIPAISDVDFFTRINPSNKILIISSLIFFYMTPFLLDKNFIRNFIQNLKIKNLIYSLSIFLILIFFFNYSIEYSGGGIFFRTSFFLFESNYLFLVIAFFSLFFILQNFKIDFNNVMLFVILIITNPQLSIYHKYYDPLLIILFFLLFNLKFIIKNIFNKELVLNFYIFYVLFLSLNFIARYLI